MSEDIYIEPPQPAKKNNGLRALIVKMGLGAFTISLIVHIIFAIVAIFFMYKWVYPPEEKVDFLPGGGGGGGSGGETVQKVKQQQNKRMMSSTAVSKRIASTSTTASFSLPDSSNELMDPGLPMDVATAELGSGGGSGGGRGKGIGTGVGSGTGPGKGFGSGQLGIGALIPTIMKGRCTDTERLSMLRDAGGTPEVEAAVKKSLQWLKGRQNSDGSWGKSNQVAMTGLTLLAYLGHCEGTQSAEYGDNVTNGIAYLLNVSMKNNGRLGTNLSANSWVYEHAIGTYALSEALTFSRTLQFKVPELEPAVEKAVKIIIEGQNQAGSWNYQYKDERNDLSVAGWHFQALKAAKASGVKAENLDKVIRKGLDYLTGDAFLGDGKFAYSGKNYNPGMTAVGSLCLQQWGKESGKEVRSGVRLIMEGLELREKPNGKVSEPTVSPLYTMDYDDPNCDPYAWYYAVQVMRNAGGKEWEAMNKAIIEDIVPAQNADGSFKPEKGGGPLVHVRGTNAAGASRDIYVQALNTLMLEVYYRFLPTSAGKGRSSGLDDLR